MGGTFVGAQILGMYKLADALGGIQARVRLAMLTTISSRAASEIPDTPDVVRKFEDALAKLRVEYSK